MVTDSDPNGYFEQQFGTTAAKVFPYFFPLGKIGNGEKWDYWRK